MMYQRESFAESAEDIKPHLQKHYDETIMYANQIPFDPDYRIYELLDKTGQLIIFTARDEGELVGYLLTLVQPYAHSQGYDMGINDMVFLKDEYRHTEVATEFFKAFEEEIADDIDILRFSFPQHNKCEGLMDHLGYDQAEVSYTKFLG